MSASTSASMSMAAVSASMAAVATVEAQRAEEQKCVMVMKQFDSKNYTTAEVREYADCVDILYPDPIGPESVILFKVIFVIALISMIVGLVMNRKDIDDLESFLIISFLCFVIPPFLVGAVIGLVYGVYWVVML